MTQGLKNAAKGLLDFTIVPLLSYIIQRIPKTTVFAELERRTGAECADYIQAKMPAALQFVRKRDLLDHAITKIGPNGLIAEFGVWNGSSINQIARKVAPSVVYGFDSFEGLKEDWAGWDMTKGKFDRRGIPPKVEANVRTVIGWFDQSLPRFLNENGQAFSFIHIDCDTYEASRTIFGLINDRIRAGTVIVFDEYFGYRGWRLGEFKAWHEFVQSHGVEYEYLSFSEQSASLRIVRRLS